MSDNGNTKVDPFRSDLDPAGLDEAAIDQGWMDRDGERLDQEMSHISTPSGVLAEGSRFGVYTVGPCIGHGGMARIYRAEHEGLRRSVALKVLLEDFAQDSEGHERFLREGRIAAAIKHPNVVNIFDVGFQGSIPYLVMEFLEGEDLESMMYARGAIPEATVIDVLLPIVAGLSAVHDAGVIHRDLKPGNIFLARGRNDEVEPKLLDFGISKQAGSEKFKLTTARGLLIGTPLYMSPEAIEGRDITPLSDQYSLGVVLYECCTGFNPFAADTLAETVRRITSGDFPPPGQRNPSLSKRMGRIIERAMSLDPAQRFTDLRELGRELLFLAGQRTRITWSLTFGEIVSRRTGELALMSAGVRSRPPARRRTNLSSIAAVAFGIVMFASAVAVVWSRRSGDGSARERVLVSQASSLRDSAAAAAPPVSTLASAATPQEVDPSPDGVVTNEPAAAPATPKADDEEEASPRNAAERGAERERSPRRATRAQRRRTRQEPRRPVARPTESRPEWAAAPEGSTPERREHRPVHGTNNAPILP